MAARKRKKLTTFQIANMLGVSDQSVSNWIDAGQLPADRTPGGHRRVEPQDLIGFLKRQGTRIPPELQDAPPTILVVDDEPDVARWLANTLREHLPPDCRFLTADDGFAAGKLVTAERPDLVILDLYMPGMDGFEACRRIKQDPETQNTRIIAVTAYPSSDAERAIRAAGAEGYLPKPPDPDELAERATQLIQ